MRHTPKGLDLNHKDRPKIREIEATSSSSNLELIDLGNDDVSHAPFIDLERLPVKMADKTRLNKQKNKEGTSSNVKDMLYVMMEERRKLCEMELECLEKGRIADHKLEMRRIHAEEEKIELEKMKMELEVEQLEVRWEWIKEEREQVKDEREQMKEEREWMKEEKEIMMMNISKLTPVQQEYIFQRQLEILANRKTRK